MNATIYTTRTINGHAQFNMGGHSVATLVTHAISGMCKRSYYKAGAFGLPAAIVYKYTNYTVTVYAQPV
jgi:hypothetical protein